MKKKIVIIITLISIFSLKAISCEFAKDRSFGDNKMSIWLGDNSEFSRAFKNGRCALDKALNNIPNPQKKVIANLIAKSYKLDSKEKIDLDTLNY